MKTRILKKVTPATIWFAFFTFYHRTVSAICVCRWWGVWIDRTFTATISIKEHKQITKFSTADSQEQEGCWICVWTTEQQWRILHSSILALPVTPVDIVKSWCALHNFVWGRDGYVFEDSLTCDMDDLAQAAAVGGRRTGITVGIHSRHISAALALSNGLIIEYKCETIGIVLWNLRFGSHYNTAYQYKEIKVDVIHTHLSRLYPHLSFHRIRGSSLHISPSNTWLLILDWCRISEY